MAGLTTRERALLGLIAVLAVLAGVANYSVWSPVPRFAVATVALAGLAWIVSFATEQLGERFGPAVTGMLQSTLGNLPELFVVIFALQKGELVVAQTAIIGSIFANALLVLGLVIVVGARRAPDGVMRFSRRLPSDTATLLLVDRLHHRAARPLARLARPRESPRQGDLGRRRRLPARRLHLVGRPLPALRRRAGREDAPMPQLRAATATARAAGAAGRPVDVMQRFRTPARSAAPR